MAGDAMPPLPPPPPPRPPPPGGGGNDSRARAEALDFIFSKDGKFFRELIMDELVKAVDALSRESLAQLIARLGLSSVRIPLLVPFAPRGASLPLSPFVTEQDIVVSRNMSMVVSFLLGERAAGAAGAAGAGAGAARVDPALLADLAPYLPAVSTEILPELNARLMSRLSARVIRDIYGVDGEAK